jgi:hypothetical protein
MGDHQGLTEGNLQFRTQNQCQQQWCAIINPLPHQEPQSSEEEHHPDIEDRVIHRIHACQAKKDDKGKEDLLRNPQDIRKERDEGQIENEEDNISNVHAGNDPPEKGGVLTDQHRSRADAVNEKSPKEDSRRRGERNTQYKERNEGGLAGSVVGRFGPGDSLDRSLPEFFRMF